MVPLRFLQCWNGYDRGAEVNFPHVGLAEDLVRMKVAELLKPAGSPPTPAAGGALVPSTPAAPTASKKKK